MSSKSGYYIDCENDAWARREATRRGTSKSEVGRDALTAYRQSFDAIPPVSRVRPIMIPRTPNTGPVASESTGESITQIEFAADFWRMAALRLMLGAQMGQTERQVTEPTADDTSSAATPLRIRGGVKQPPDLHRGSLVRVRRRDGSFYLARVC